MNPLYVALGALLLGVGLFVGGYHFGGLSAKAETATALAKAYQAQEKAHQAKEAAYEKEIDGLKTDSLSYPTVAVRLCPAVTVPAPRQSGQVLPTSTGLGKENPIPVPPSQGPDYGPSLFGLADEFDQVTAKCR